MSMYAEDVVSCFPTHATCTSKANLIPIVLDSCMISPSTSSQDILGEHAYHGGFCIKDEGNIVSYIVDEDSYQNLSRGLSLV